MKLTRLQVIVRDMREIDKLPWLSVSRVPYPFASRKSTDKLAVS